MDETDQPQQKTIQSSPVNIDDQPVDLVKNQTVYYKNWRFYVLAFGFLLSTLSGVYGLVDSGTSVESILYITFASLSAFMCTRIIIGGHIPKIVLNITIVIAIIMEIILIIGIIGLFAMLSAYDKIGS